eukprot:6199564-Pleurochrysis_carterae.AAC.2
MLHLTDQIFVGEASACARERRPVPTQQRGTPAAMEQHEQLILALMSPDNTIRGQAEEAYNQAKQQPAQLLPVLIGLLGGSGNEQVRQRQTVHCCAS